MLTHALYSLVENCPGESKRAVHTGVQANTSQPPALCMFTEPLSCLLCLHRAVWIQRVLLRCRVSKSNDRSLYYIQRVY